MRFNAIKDIKPLYFLPKDNLVEEVLIPAFHEAETVDCMMGFFSSESFRSLAPGLATFLNESDKTLRLIVSPFLQPQDRDAIKKGIQAREDIVKGYFLEWTATEDNLEKHTLQCLAYLIQYGRLDIKIALMRSALFHPKVWLFHRGTDIIGVHGSSNFTGMGIQKNFEQISVAQSWQDPNQSSITYTLNDQFMRLWKDIEDDCSVIPVSKAIKNNLIQEHLVSSSPTEDDYLKLYKQAGEALLVAEDTPSYEKPKFRIPSWLKYEEGAFAHQGRAVDAWAANGNRGILEMATGSGKTITAMICAYRLYKNQKPLLIVVAAPYLPLIEQWCGEVEVFGLRPTNLTKLSGEKARSRELQKIRRRLKSGMSEVESIIVSHDTLCSESFQNAVSKFQHAKMLIADEAHNLGRNEFIRNPPVFFEYRLALSATPVRQYDQEGTEALFDFFGPSVFQFSLEEAIGTCLVEYDYYVHPVYLTEEEMDTWYELSAEIRKNAWQSDSKGPSEYLAKLFRDRRKLLETAKNKIKTLNELLTQNNLKELRHTLVYTTDKDPEQLNEVNQLLMEKGVLFHQLTADETRQRERCQRIIKNFQDGSIQVLTAKRVLDEGVNIPQINKAYILASTTVERQWIQRRGRLLRTCSEVCKTHSEIHDFISLPAGYDEISLDEDAKKLIKSELNRTLEFARSSRNSGLPSGALPIINKMVNAIYL